MVGSPVRIAPRPKRQEQVQNTFFDDRGFPDQSDHYDQLLPTIDRGVVLRKLSHPVPDLIGPIDPRFHSVFRPEIHKPIMRKVLDLTHLPLDLQDEVYSLI